MCSDMRKVCLCGVVQTFQLCSWKCHDSSWWCLFCPPHILSGRGWNTATALTEWLDSLQSCTLYFSQGKKQAGVICWASGSCRDVKSHHSTIQVSSMDFGFLYPVYVLYACLAALLMLMALQKCQIVEVALLVETLESVNQLQFKQTTPLSVLVLTTTGCRSQVSQIRQTKSSPDTTITTDTEWYVSL